jgi:hypothetical protein
MAAVTTTSALALRASVPAPLRDMLFGPPCTGTVLARFPTAVYVAVPRAFGLLAVLARDAVRLPCGLQLPQPRLDLPLDDVQVGAGLVRVGTAEIRPGRVVSMRVAPRAAAASALVREAAQEVDRVDIEIGLLGRGPGLTPWGDDVLAGYLAGAAAYALEIGELRAEIASAAPARTTTLSSALLQHAAAGETIPQIDGLLDALDGRRPLATALAELRAVGHTSGAGLAAGVVAAAVAA